MRQNADNARELSRGPPRVSNEAIWPIMDTSGVTVFLFNHRPAYLTARRPVARREGSLKCHYTVFMALNKRDHTERSEAGHDSHPQRAA